MKRLVVIALLVVTVMSALASSVTGCSAPTPDNSDPIATGDITKENLADVCGVLEDSGLHNIDVFEKWVNDTNAGGSGTDPVDSDSGFNDADCRMTVLLLAGDDIGYESLEEEYSGTYLMFDLDVIQKNSLYGVLAEKSGLLTTLFGEMEIPESGFRDAFTSNLEKYGIRFDSKKYSVISLVFKAYETDEAFVGHTGILVPYEDEFLFVEKIAFDEPYRVTVVKDEKELIDVLSERPDYTVEDGEPAALVYKNSELIGSLDE